MCNNTSLLLLAAVLVSLFTACDSETPVPKPRAYPKVVYPEKKYKPFESGYCHFTFDQPAYANVERDSTFFEGGAGSDCWFNLNIPSLNATVYCSYYPVTNKKRFDELTQDAFNMANKHNIKASFIEEMQISRPQDKVYGMIYAIDGPVASPYQFFVTDSTRHFLRGSLYFRTQARPDSLAPVVAFMKKDINRMLETLQWQE
jgi:gliding motility-associated lipoprotein GldD